VASDLKNVVSDLKIAARSSDNKLLIASSLSLYGSVLSLNIEPISELYAELELCSSEGALN
jgi:hypothetical protein